MIFNNPQMFVDIIHPIALQIQEKYSIPALFITAQGALESSWGKKAIGNNLFGIKAGKNWNGKKLLITTCEFLNSNNYKFPEIISITKAANGSYKYVVKDWFRDYDTLEECMIDHARVLLLPHFLHAIGITDPYEYAKAIQNKALTGGKTYATASNYAESIKAVVRSVERRIK